MNWLGHAERPAAAAVAVLTANLLLISAAAAGPLPDADGIWAIPVMGITLSVLATGLFASTLRHLGEPAPPDTKIPGKVLGIVTDGFTGGWLAMFLTTAPATREHLGGVPPQVVAAVLALAAQWVRDNAPRYINEAWQTIRSWWTRKPAAAPTEPGDR